ncbi:uncharacterized protein METZ01_LOCUS275161, partial [marine metagenome]
MKKVSIAYGNSRLEVDVPSYAEVILPSYSVPFENPGKEINNSIRDPVNSKNLKELVREDDIVAISICDVTRPMPSGVVLTEILDELDHVDKQN